MDQVSTMPEMTELELIVVDPVSRTILVSKTAQGSALLFVQISAGSRLARELIQTIRATWGLEVLILDFLPGVDLTPSYVAAELLHEVSVNQGFRMLNPEQLIGCGVPERALASLFEMLEARASLPFSNVGWIDEALSWVAESTGQIPASKSLLEQWNFGCNFALLRFGMNNGNAYWLKATGTPNEHEYDITVGLSVSYSQFLPPLIAARKDWNAWLTEGFGSPLPDGASAEALTCAAATLASFQLQTTEGVKTLLALGAFDQRLPLLREQVEPIGRFLLDAMARQKTTQVAPISRERLLELTVIVREACDHMASLGIPDALLHNDLSKGNILYDGYRCVFTDWSEAAIGNPFLSCERLCQLNTEQGEAIRTAYRDSWSNRLSTRVINEALTVAPLLDIFAYLVGRGDWIARQEHAPHFYAHARSLARYMDRAAHIPAIRTLLCH